ncbi:PilZ domain-containing protein [Sphingomonas piscis]|uniref:PilZ domain-containing protein n=1 Tax=Sphingomonas piscis TaxID=2714943 RepID=A0A6G7YM59_9SPHN|nr:PilZ domain-containing protein [Sphingomonas piscis]QIK77828.1 PilZ domain-containing protein [Sphingomonas piscis]
MTFERGHNSFREALLRQPGTSPVVPDKAPRGKRGNPALSASAVARKEVRRSDDRDGDRHRLTDAGATVRSGRRKVAVELINISGGGAMVRGDLRARLWQKVILILGDVGEVECAVRWIRDDRFGLEFAHETQIACDPATLNETLLLVLKNNAPKDVENSDPEPLTVEPSDPRRTARRHPLIWSGLVQFNHESAVARLRNISAEGAQIQSTGSYNVGNVVLLDLGNAGALPATVRWAHGDQAGLAFHRPFDVTKLAKVQPQVAGRGWVKPEYLQDEDVTTSPWASQWGRLTVGELKKTLLR